MLEHKAHSFVIRVRFTLEARQCSVTVSTSGSYPLRDFSTKSIDFNIQF